MKKIFIVGLMLCFGGSAFAQNSKYIASLTAYQNNYVKVHEVVKKADKKYFRFFPIDNSYNINCPFEKIHDTVGFDMKTSANTLKHFYKYGKISFTIHDTAAILYIYQGKDLIATEQYKEYLFVPFTDPTNGNDSYGSGRYLEFYMKNIKNGRLQVDFNKAYNPYCAYAAGFRCPIPPKENHLPVAIKAGEKTFAKPH